MRLVAFNVNELQTMFMALSREAERWRPSARLKSESSRALNKSFYREYEALARRIGTALRQAENAIATNIAVTGQTPPSPPEQQSRDATREPPRLLTLNVRELGSLSMAMNAHTSTLEYELKKELAKRSRSKADRDYIRHPGFCAELGTKRDFDTTLVRKSTQ